MEPKKVIIIALAILAVVFLALYLGSMQSFGREREYFKKENAALTGQVSKFQESIRSYENRIESLNRRIAEISAGSEELQRKYELANRAREELAEKLRQRQERPSYTLSPAPEIPAGTDAYWAGILKQKTDLEMQLDTMRADLKATIINNEQLQRDKAGLELDIKNLKHESDDINRQFDYNKKIMDSIAQELVREKNDKMQIQESFKAIKSENAILTGQLKGLNNRKIAVEKKLQDFNEEKAALLKKVDELEVMLKDKLAQADTLGTRFDTLRAEVKTESARQDSVMLPPIVVKPSNLSAAGNIAPLGFEGKILAINRENNFVIIDLGENHNVQSGDSFRVYRAEKPVADISVIQARSAISACDIKREAEEIKIGDQVKQ